MGDAGAGISTPSISGPCLREPSRDTCPPPSPSTCATANCRVFAVPRGTIHLMDGQDATPSSTSDVRTSLPPIPASPPSPRTDWGTGRGDIGVAIGKSVPSSTGPWRKQCAYPPPLPRESSRLELLCSVTGHLGDGNLVPLGAICDPAPLSSERENIRNWK